MSNIKRFCAILIAVLLIISTATACNASATWIMKADGEEVPVGIYICYIMQSRSEAKDKIDEAAAEKTTEKDEPKEDATQAATEEIDYEKQKVEDKSYAEWIKDEALLKVKEHLVIKNKFKEYKLSLTDEQEEKIKSVWTTSVSTEKTYGDYYELNGVSRSSLEEYVRSGYEKDELMKYYYGADGEEPIKKDELVKNLKENYVTTYILSQSKVGLNADKTAYENYSDDIISQMKSKMKGYITRLDKKEDYAKVEKDFKADMAKILGTESDGSSDAASATTDKGDKDELKPTPNIQLRSISDDSDEIAAALKKAKMGVAGLAESDGVLTVYKKTNDLIENPYYLDAQKQAIIEDIKGDEFDQLIEKLAGELTVTVNSKAVSTYTESKLKDFK